MDRAKLHADLVRDEGLKAKPYVDTVGKVTIGIGYNLTDRGLPLDIIETLFDRCVVEVESDLDRALPWWRQEDDVRQRVLVNLAYNMGISRLLAFHDTLAAWKACDYPGAADRLMASRWYRQVGHRGPRLVAMLRTGQDPQ